MKRSENIIEISKALNIAQREMKPALKDSTNPHFKSKYSDLASVMEAIREPIGNNGLSILQDATLDENGVSITTTLLHISGQWLEFGPLTIPIGKRDAHAVGSACSYGKRYSLCAALGVVSDEDDDGNKAVSSNSKSPTPPKPQQNQFPDARKMIDNTPKASVDHIGDVNEMVHKLMTTSKEWKELENLMNQCVDTFQRKLCDRLLDLGVDDNCKLDMETFMKMRKACIEHIEKRKANETSQTQTEKQRMA